MKLIGDGHDRQFYIKGEDGLYPPTRFNGRYVAHHAAALIYAEALEFENKNDIAGANRVFASAMADRLTGWSYFDADDGLWHPVADENGTKVQPTQETLGRYLPFKLFSRVRDVILGMSASDPDPDKKDDNPHSREDNEKNSATGSG